MRASHCGCEAILFGPRTGRTFMNWREWPSSVFLVLGANERTTSCRNQSEIAALDKKRPPIGSSSAGRPQLA